METSCSSGSWHFVGEIEAEDDAKVCIMELGMSKQGGYNMLSSCKFSSRSEEWLGECSNPFSCLQFQCSAICEETSEQKGVSSALFSSRNRVQIYNLQLGRLSLRNRKILGNLPFSKTDGQHSERTSIRGYDTPLVLI